MSADFDFFDEYDDEEWEATGENIGYFKEKNKQRRKLSRKQDRYNSVEKVPDLTDEILAKRKIYEDDYARAHIEVFTNSTGIKPLGPAQIQSSQHTNRIVSEGGRLLKLEPRGFGKTSRSSNEALLAALQGKRKYILILAASQPKATEILESISTELITNEVLYELYPQECECFRHLDDNFARARFQTLAGEKTYIKFNKDTIIFPHIPGSASSGSIIKVRTKDNVRGTFVKVKEGPHKGKVLRPDMVFMDDLQTDEDAENPRTVNKIVTLIKKSVLRSGTHSKQLAAIFAATPICAGDVPHFFYFNEPSWEYVSYKMLEKLPDRMDLWLGEYKRRLLNFDRSKAGSRAKARMYALEYYRENQSAMDAGAKPNWEWCYEWGEETETEISAIQHAINILIEEGEDVFRSECQTELTNEDLTDGFKRCPIDTIMSKQTHRPRFHTSTEARHIVTHIDVQKRYLAYVTAASPDMLQPEIINYGTFPKQPGQSFSKDNMYKTLEDIYPDVPEHDIRIYLAIKELTEQLQKQEFYREDGVILYHSLILCDSRYESHKVRQALNDSAARSICKAHNGMSVMAKDRPIAMRSYSEGCQVHHECVTVPTKHTSTLTLHSNINYMKTEIHKGFIAREGIPGSCSLFKEEYVGQHRMFAEHLWAEEPFEDIYEKEERKVICWRDTTHKPDNEYLDNLVGCFGGFLSLGCILRQIKKKATGMNMQEYMDRQRNI